MVMVTQSDKPIIELLKTTRDDMKTIAENTGYSYTRIRKLNRELRLRQLTPDEIEENRLHDEAKARAESMLMRGASLRSTILATELSRGVVSVIARQPHVIATRAMEEVYIYALCCPLSRQAFYVGGAENPWRRYYQHIKAPYLQAMADWLDDLATLGKSPKLKILERLWTNDRFGVEREWILRLSAAGHPLMNREVQ